MTAYHGGKQRIGKQLAEVIYDTSIEMESRGASRARSGAALGRGFQIKGYCEPFCGMLGVYQHIPALFQDHKPKLKYKAGDANKSVILMWKAAQKGWKPPINISKEKYDELKYNGLATAEKGYIGHQCAFGGQYFGSYRKERCTEQKLQTSSENIKNTVDKVKKTIFKHGDYNQYSDLKGYIIYCDPPYANTRQHYFSNDNWSSGTRVNSKFDSAAFWEWCEKMSHYNIIFVSEYNVPKKLLPENTKVVFRKPVKISYGRSTAKENKEKLYMLKNEK